MSKNGADNELPNVSHQHLQIPASAKLAVDAPAEHRPRILLLYGSLRARSYSRFLTFEAARLLETFGAETRIFDPQGLPLPDDELGIGDLPIVDPEALQVGDLGIGQRDDQVDRFRPAGEVDVGLRRIGGALGV